MSTQKPLLVEADNFRIYLRGQKKMIIIATCVSAACFIMLKYFFPLPDFFVDSTSYVACAFYKMDVAYRPMGYSNFLRMLHNISSASLFTVFIQYFLFFLSSLFCFFSMDYLAGLPEKPRWPLLIVILVNPLLIFQTNLISSDSVFCSLTVIWFTSCLWIIRQHKWWALLLQLIFLYCCFCVRYTAMFFPVIAVAGFIFCRGNRKYKFLGVALSVSVILFAVRHQKDLTEEKTSTRVFSGFAGWQIANNALYCYKELNINNDDLPTKELRTVDKVIRRYIDSIPTSKGAIGTAYIWDSRSPLIQFQYMAVRYLYLTRFESWFAVSKPFNDYGWYIVRNFPRQFMLCYILPNTKKYFYPDAEALANYNCTNVQLPEETKEWFNLSEDHISCGFEGLQHGVISVYPFVSLLLNVFNIAAIFFFLFMALRRRRKISHYSWTIYLTWSLFYFAFAMFTIFATAVNLRFMDPIFVLGLIMPFALLNSIRPINQT
jgi:hypothetical protein